jgi:hypothetical protein
MVVEKIPFIQDGEIYSQVLLVVKQYLYVEEPSPLELYEYLLTLCLIDYNRFILIETHLQKVFK